MNLYLKKAVVLVPTPGSKRNVEETYVGGTEVVFIALPVMLRFDAKFEKIKHWRNYGYVYLSSPMLLSVAKLSLRYIRCRGLCDVTRYVKTYLHVFTF